MRKSLVTIATGKTATPVDMVASRTPLLCPPCAIRLEPPRSMLPWTMDYRSSPLKSPSSKEEGGLHWPLHVYGLIATRDSIDHRRNLLFQRARDNCQTITQEDPFLLLTGPTRAVVLIDPVAFEVQLKAKGKTESEDKVLIFSVFFSQYACGYSSDPPCINTKCLDGSRSKLEVTFALISHSVEATFRVEVVHGSWPDHLRGLVVTRTASLNQDIVLVDS